MNRRCSVDPKSFKERLCVGLVSLLAPLLCGGCVALSIPSVRYDDPTDRGGMFGPHRSAGVDSVEHTVGGDSGGLGEVSQSGARCADESLEDIEEYPPPKTPEVPWPRFHPLPTRPVFSTFPEL